MFRIYRISGLVFALVVGLGFALAVFPAMATPNEVVLYAAVTPNGSGDCSSWANVCTLQTALSNAVSGDQIWVQAGVHKPTTSTDRAIYFKLKDGVAIYGGFVGTETALDERNWEMNLTILSGDIDNNDLTDPNGVVTDTDNIIGANTYHIVISNEVSEITALDGFIITAGSTNGYGAGLGNYGSSPTLSNLIIIGNDGAIGGGMYNSGGNPRLTNIIFRNNDADQVGGGMVVNQSSPILTNVTFYGNLALVGGGMYNSYDGNPVLTNVTFNTNGAFYRGGGIANFENSNPILTNVIFNSNRSLFSGFSNGGGGIYNDDSSPILINVSFYGNHAFDYGGGMYNTNNSNPTLINNILWDNNTNYDFDYYDQIANSLNSTPLISYSDIEGSGGSGGGWATILGTDGGGNIDADPLFVDSANDDLHIGLNSPVIDAGNNFSVTVTTDLEGNPRFVDILTVPDTGNGTSPLIDMGAYEAYIKKIEYRIYLPLTLQPIP